MITSILILDEKVTSGITCCHGISSDDADYIGTSGSQPLAVLLATESDTGVGKDDSNQSVASQQEENGRSGGSGDSMNNAGGNKGSNHARFTDDNSSMCSEIQRSLFSVQHPSA